MRLIDKDALVAEIERRRESNAKEKFFGRLVEDNYFLDFIDTLEVKEPDFEKEFSRIWFDFGEYFNNSAVNFARIRSICKHFFELGLKAQKGEEV